MTTSACSGKVVLVVGGTRGIGRAAVLALAEAGAAVIPTGRSRENAESAADEARRSGVESFPLVFDVTDPVASAEATAEVVRRLGRLDALVVSAGINPYFHRAEEVTAEMWDRLMAVNLRGAFFAVQAAGRQMLAQEAGSIVCVSSVTAAMGVSRGLPYVASKGGLDAMVRSLAIEWSRRGVRVNGIAPGFITTDLTKGVRKNPAIRDSILRGVPLGRFGSPEEVAALIVYLVSDASSYVTGQSFVIDGGMGLGRA
ncbi:MAG TPA: SDR family NAD(P)-dependent oxidoreductase [Candidatus Binataceae bacterium]|nr:SDR family NAD(P)-dependent oxidoreductase [Candidatus Binataceae bacterium]